MGKKLKTLIMGGIALESYITYRTVKRIQAVKDNYDQTVLFSKQDFHFEGKSVTSDAFVVGFSNVLMDYRGAVALGNQVDLNLYTEYSQVTIVLPKEWKVQLDGLASFANVSLNKGNPKSIEIENADNSSDELAPLQTLMRIRYDATKSNINIVKV